MRLIIDRFEGMYAVCEKEDRTMVNIERSRLPEGAKDGDVLTVEGLNIAVDEGETIKRKEKIEKMMKGLWK